MVRNLSTRLLGSIASILLCVFIIIESVLDSVQRYFSNIINMTFIFKMVGLFDIYIRFVTITARISVWHVILFINFLDKLLQLNVEEILFVNKIIFADGETS